MKPWVREWPAILLLDIFPGCLEPGNSLLDAGSPDLTGGFPSRDAGDTRSCPCNPLQHGISLPTFPQSQGCGYPDHVLLSPLSFQRRCLFLSVSAHGSLPSRHCLLLHREPLWATLTYLLGKGCSQLLLLQESTWIRAGKGLAGKKGSSPATSLPCAPLNWEKGSDLLSGCHLISRGSVQSQTGAQR